METTKTTREKELSLKNSRREFNFVIDEKKVECECV